ncbi:MAG: helix-turn-helix transcriptional regulator [Porticoccaceae bacterium]|jgi:transcriptional regulator with XRE-family HTH domain
MDELNHKFGRVLRQVRQEYRWSQEVLADRAGLNRCYLGEVERGEAVPSLLTLAKLAVALDIPLSRLLARCERPQQQSSPMMAID